LFTDNFRVSRLLVALGRVRNDNRRNEGKERMKTQNQNRAGRFSRVVVAVALASAVLVTSENAVAKPPPPAPLPDNFEARVCFTAAQNDLNVSAPWGKNNPIADTTANTTGSLVMLPGDQIWQLVPDVEDFVFNIAPNGRGTFNFWIELNLVSQIRVAGEFTVTRASETAPVVLNGTARIVETWGYASGYTLTNGKLHAVSPQYDWAQFDTAPTAVGFAQDTSQYPSSNPGFSITGRLSTGTTPPPAPQLVAPVAVKSTPTAQQIVNAGLKALEVEPATSEKEVDGALSAMEEALGLPVGGENTEDGN
jgi:hypothetical protein